VASSTLLPSLIRLEFHSTEADVEFGFSPKSRRYGEMP